MMMDTSLAIVAGMPGPMEIIVIFAVLCLLFGVKKIPTMARSLGQSLSSFKVGQAEGKRMLREMEEDLKGAVEDDA